MEIKQCFADDGSINLYQITLNKNITQDKNNMPFACIFLQLYQTVCNLIIEFFELP